MITDDPGTPGNRHWETTIWRLPSRICLTKWSLEAPAIDLNYGWAIRLTFQASAALLKRSHHGLVGGIGGQEAAVKWRFLDEDRNGVDMSMFPRLLFNVLQSSIGRGLAEDGTRFRFRFRWAKKFGRLDLDAEFGPLFSSAGRGELLYGVVGGTELTKTTSLMAKVQPPRG